jgi:hypothetical protein
MIHFSKNVQYWSFWCQWWSDHQDLDVCWGNCVVEALEASEVAEATEVNEAAKIWEITNEVFKGILRFLNSIIWELISFSFDVLVKMFFARIMKTRVEFPHLFYRRLLRPVFVTFLKTGWWNSNAQTSGVHWYLHFDLKVVFRWPPRSPKYIKSGWKTL